MQEKEYTYRPVSASVLTESFRSLLFGRLSAIQLCRDYRELKPVIRNFIMLANSIPEQYENIRATLPGLPKIAISDKESKTLEVWENPFYRFEVPGLKAFHPLCEFYQSFVYRECRLVVAQAERWRCDNRISTRSLRYELISLAELLGVFIRVCDERYVPKDESGSELAEKLRKYLAQLLMHELGATLFELSERFKKMLVAKTLSPEAFYIHILNQTVPEQQPFYPTRFWLHYVLGRMNFERKLASNLKVLKELQEEVSAYQSKERSKERRACFNQIENMCVAYYLLKASSADATAFASLQSDPASSEKIVRHWRKIVKEGKQEDVIFSFCRYLDKIQLVLGHQVKRASPSEAVLLLRAIEHQGIPSRQPGHDQVNEILDTYTNHTNNNTHPLLLDLVSIDELRERLQISMVTLNKYLDDSGIPVIRFSAKSRWLRSEDCYKFLDYFTTKGREDG